MTGKPHFDWRLLGLRAAAIAAGLALFLAQAAVPVTAAGETRTLWFHHTHTGKDGKFTFKKNGQYDPAVLREMNIFLADWRTGTPTKMDPALFDLLASPPPTPCCAPSGRASPRTASTCWARRWMCSFRA